MSLEKSDPTTNMTPSVHRTSKPEGRIGPGATILLVVGLAMLAFAALDVREVAHQR